jgi:protein phosphatase PTC7
MFIFFFLSWDLDKKLKGSATACILGINCLTGRLYSVNIGDSGFVIIRQGCIIYRSQSQEINGDCPRQLDVYPWTSSLKQLGINHTQISYVLFIRPCLLLLINKKIFFQLFRSIDAICQTFDLKLNDIIILSTDGLFDNVPDYLIEQILSQASLRFRFFVWIYLFCCFFSSYRVIL